MDLKINIKPLKLSYDFEKNEYILEMEVKGVIGEEEVYSEIQTIKKFK